MSYELLYRGQFVNQETNALNENIQQIITINIEDTESGEADEPETIIPLAMADSPLRIEVVDNAENKYTTLRPKQAEISIHTSDSIGLETFCEGGDNRYKVHIYSEVETLFIGFISISDLQEDFQPDPNILTLTAFDGLGFLESEDLTDFDGTIPMNEHKIIEFLVWAFAKTGLSLHIKVVMNIRERFATPLISDDTGDGHFFKWIYLDAKTFEGSDVGTTLSCQEVLKRILGAQCFITQKNGVWWIINVDEMRINNSYFVTEFDDTGAWISTTEQVMTKSIGVSSPMQWMNDDAVKSTERPNKKVELTYPYEYPREIPCNPEFERGEGDEPTNASSETIDYTLDCWSFLREGATVAEFDSAPAVGSTGVLRKLFEFGYEKDRYLVIEIAGGFRHYFKSTPIKINLRDKFSINTNYKFNNDYGAVRVEIAHVRLIGDDGFVYDWNYDSQTNTNQWVQKSPTDTIFDSLVNDDITNLDTRDWLSLSAESLPAPASGKLYFRLVMGQGSGNIKYYSKFSYTYIPLINGSYGKYTGQTISVTQLTDPEKYKAKIEETVYISDAPNQLVKGALLKRGDDQEIFEGEADFAAGFYFQVDGDQRNLFEVGQRIVITGSTSNNIETTILSVSYALFTDLTTVIVSDATSLEINADVTISLVTFVLANRFYDAASFPNADFPDETYVHPFGEIQVYGYYNQYNRVMRKFEGAVDRLESGTELPDMVHLFLLTDANANTNNKIFMLLHLSMDLHLCSWDAFFHEIEDSTIAKVYVGNEFKYITDE